jgi:bla regulator protein blaR1
MIPTSEGVGFWLLKSSGQAAVLVVLVLTAQWLLRRRLAPGRRYCLWWLVVLRLVVPVSPESLLSIFK